MTTQVTSYISVAISGVISEIRITPVRLVQLQIQHWSLLCNSSVGYVTVNLTTNLNVLYFIPPDLYSTGRARLKVYMSRYTNVRKDKSWSEPSGSGSPQCCLLVSPLALYLCELMLRCPCSHLFGGSTLLYVKRPKNFPGTGRVQAVPERTLRIS
jgi:hypothetical protein